MNTTPRTALRRAGLVLAGAATALVIGGTANAAPAPKAPAPPLPPQTIELIPQLPLLENLPPLEYPPNLDHPLIPFGTFELPPLPF